MKTVAVLGGDERNLYLCRCLKKAGYDVSWLFAEKCDKAKEFTKTGNYSGAYAVILPLPLTRDEITLNTPLSEEKIKLSDLDFSLAEFLFTSDDRTGGINYFKDEAVTTDNARLTAVGLLKELLLYEKRDILGKKALVTGFGRVSGCVCDILKGNGLYVTVSARNRNQRHSARVRGFEAFDIETAKKNLGAYDYVINTVPKKLFSMENILKAGKNTAFFELASGLIEGTDIIPSAYIECKGMPGKHLPESAGEVIGRFVCEKMRE